MKTEERLHLEAKRSGEAALRILERRGRVDLAQELHVRLFRTLTFPHGAHSFRGEKGATRMLHHRDMLRNFLRAAGLEERELEDEIRSLVREKWRPGEWWPGVRGPAMGDPADWRRDRSEILNPSAVPDFIAPEIPNALSRIRSAGASGPLEYVGAGSYGIVFCDHDGKAWKAFRLGLGSDRIKHLVFLRGAVEEEYEWLSAAARTEIAPNVARVHAIHPEELVLERECVQGSPGGWGDATMLSALHSRIWKAMEPEGWTAPEFKENSYIIQPDGTPKLVDISMPIRIGMNLAAWVEAVLEGRRAADESWHSLAFYVLREMRMKTIPEEFGKRLLRRLNELDPSIAEGFGVKWLMEEKGPAMGAAPEDLERADLYALGGAIEAAGIRPLALEAWNHPGKREHTVIFNLRIDRPEARATAESIIARHGLEPLPGSTSMDSILFTFPRTAKALNAGKLDLRKAGPTGIADLLKVVQEIRDAGFWVTGLDTMLHDPPPIWHPDFTVEFSAVHPQERQAVEDILERHGFASIGGGTLIKEGGMAASDVGFVFASTKDVLKRRR